MKTLTSYLFFLFIGFLGYLNFSTNLKIESKPKEWQPSHDVVMEINSLKVEANKEYNRCKIEQQEILSELEFERENYLESIDTFYVGE